MGVTLADGVQGCSSSINQFLFCSWFYSAHHLFDFTPHLLNRIEVWALQGFFDSIYGVRNCQPTSQNRKIRLGTRKTGHSGLVYAWLPMTTKLYHALGQHKLSAKHEHVFTDPDTGKPYITRKGYMMRLCKRAKVTPFGYHAIRHLTATILAYEGLSLPEVQEVLRHSNPNTTARYIKKLERFNFEIV